MLDFPRWKIWGTILVLAIGVALAMPSLLSGLLSDATMRAIGLAGAPRVNLGLDLSGGSRLLLEADTADVARARIATMEETVQAEMRRGTPRIAIGDISTADNRLSFLVRDIGQLDAAVDRIRKLTQGVGLTGQRDWDVSVVDATRIVMAPTASGLTQSIDQAMEVATEVVRKRIDELGTREPSIVRQGKDRIDVQVPGLGNPEALKALLGKTAKLEFKLVDLTARPDQVAQGRAPAGSQVLPLVEGGRIAVKRRAIITGDQLTDASQTYDPQTNRPDVTIRFNSQGGARFAQVTRENVGKPFAIILDNQVLSAPVIQTAILGGSAVITGNYTIESANALAISLRSGKLPVTLKVIEERTVGPGLGQDSIRAGVLAAAIAVAAVIAFMVLTYGRFGLYATAAVIINLFVILGVLALLDGTLTLPGIAGFVLTIGTAVDANVLINERIREERRRGRSIIASVEHGYKEASRTIFEANVTHAIAGGIMLVLGSGPVKGFAVVLLIGIATSVFTAVTFTRLLVVGWLKRKRPTEIVI